MIDLVHRWDDKGGRKARFCWEAEYLNNYKGTDKPGESATSAWSEGWGRFRKLKRQKWRGTPSCSPACSLQTKVGGGEHTPLSCSGIVLAHAFRRGLAAGIRADDLASAVPPRWRGLGASGTRVRSTSELPNAEYFGIADPTYRARVTLGACVIGKLPPSDWGGRSITSPLS